MESKHPGGRPLLFTDVEELKQRIDAYFLEMDREEDTRVFAHESIEVEEYPDIDPKTQALTTQKRVICTKCRRAPFSSGLHPALWGTEAEASLHALRARRVARLLPL